MQPTRRAGTWRQELPIEVLILSIKVGAVLGAHHGRSEAASKRKR